MSNLLTGNGTTIQFGGIDYLNSSIVNRAMRNIASGMFPAHLYPAVCSEMLSTLQRELSEVLRGKYDTEATTSYSRSALGELKRRYRTDRAYKIDEIGFEDYFLILELVHCSQGVSNPERFQNEGAMRRMFLDAVYNGGELERVHRRFTPAFVSWVRTHESVVTTNYDSNIEAGCGVAVHHLHGCFRTLGESYDPKSFRNQLSDDLLEGEKMDPAYPYLYSTALVSYAGTLKQYSMSLSGVANRGMEKFASGYREDPVIRQQIDSWPEDNDLTRRLKEAIRLKANNPSLKHGDQYPYQVLARMSGTLEILGLSPSNDSHIVSEVLENDKITHLIFYYHGEGEAEVARGLFCGKSVEARNACELWENLGTR